MEQTQEFKPTEASKALITLTPMGATRRKQLRFRLRLEKITRRGVLTLAALSLLALPVGLAVSNRQDLRFSLPLMEQILSRPSAQPSAVLAVDSHGMTIHGKNLSVAARKHLEQAALEQLARLHPIYAGWVATDEEAVGTMLLKIYVDGAGNVARIESLRSRLSSGDFAKVVLAEIREWNFTGASAQPFEITMPLLFVPKGLDANTVVQWERRTRDSEADRKIAKLAHGSPALVAPRPSSVNAKPEDGRLVANANVKKTISSKAALPVVKTTQAVALRQQPRFAAERVHEVDAETELKLLERKGDWLKVRMADARAVGFVRKEYLTPVN
ncbi:MAG: SH3 domain-containing protein [Candidatus Binatia bacterium]